jgi:Arc/MetJ-type ribon-helix-helix transcriptional regulator
MADKKVRAHVALPKKLVDEIDRLVGRGKRNAFIAEAVEEKLGRERLGRALAATAGMLDRDSYPEWATPEDVSAWVRALRSVGRDHTDQKPRGNLSG